MTRSVSRLFVATLLGTTLTVGALATDAMVQSAAPSPAVAPAAPAQGTPPSGLYTEADARAILNARLAALKAVIELTPEQEKLWPALETAIRDINKNAIARRKQLETAAAPKSFLDVLDQMAVAEETHGKELKRFVDAARPFVALLTEAQKRCIPAFLGLNDGEGQHQPAGTLWLFEEEAG